MRFLVSRLSSLGDIVCSLPAAVALKRGFPESEIVWIVDRRFRDVVRCCSAVDKVEEARPPCSRASWPALLGPFDTAFDLQGLFKSAWPVALACAREKLGYHWQREGSSLASRKVLPDPTSFHIVDQYVDVARAAGGIMERAEFGIEPDAGAMAKVSEGLLREGVERFVAFNPGAGWATKRWPEDRWSGLVDEIHSHGFRALMIGGSSAQEQAAADAISAACKERPLSWVGKTNIAELIALLSKARAHVGGDTGSTHIAAAVGVPCVGLYSITNPRRSCPYGQIDGCIHQPSSLAEISVDQVFAKLEGALA